VTKHIVTESLRVVDSQDGVLAFRNDGKVIVQVYPDGVVETRQGYDAELVARKVWQPVTPKTVTLSFFPNDTGEALVAFNRDGRAVYRKGYTPDPVARELWECIAEMDPWYKGGPPPGQTFVIYREPEVGGTKPNPGFTGVWGTNGDIDCFRPR